MVLSFKYLKQNNDQLGLLSNEEDLLQEMQLICDERERIYGISREMFMR
jgi:hypothetical protein